VSTGPARRWVAAAIAAAILPLVACDDGRSADLGETSSSAQTGDRDAGAADALARLEQALRRRDGESAREVAAPRREAERELTRLARNADRLDLAGLSLRHLADSAISLADRQRERWGDDAWVADVQVTWRYAGVDRALSTLAVPMVFTRADDGVRLVTADLPQTERAPVWLTDAVRVARSDAALAVTTGDHSAQDFLRLADRAARTVRLSLPRWQGVLCIVVPADQRAFKTVAGVPQTQAAAVAAVTTTPDGSTAEGSPQHVYVNPRLFEPLESEGRQIVLSHEAVHVALGAALLDLPLWLSEGIADHVALLRSATPVEKLGAQILQQTRKQGAPRALPGKRQFDGTDHKIGAWYEAAWLAVRLIADTYGEDELWRFYRRSVSDQGTEAAFRDVLGTTQQQFVQRWRQHLTELAG
jgi:hypothetical protein